MFSKTERSNQRSSKRFSIRLLLAIQVLTAFSIGFACFLVVPPKVVVDIRESVQALELKGANRRYVRAKIRELLRDNSVTVELVVTEQLNFDVFHLPNSYQLVVYYSMSEDIDSAEFLTSTLISPLDRIYGNPEIRLTEQ